MKFIEIAKKRFSVRSYLEKPVEAEKVSLILEAGRVAPTAANLQPQRMLVLQKPESLEKLKKGANVYGAPLAILVCADHRESWKRPFDGKDIGDVDTAIVTDHMMLQATELGLGTVWVCYFNPQVIREAFSLPEYLEPVNILGIGYATTQAEASEAASPDRHATKRKPLEDIVSYETID